MDGVHRRVVGLSMQPCACRSSHREDKGEEEDEEEAEKETDRQTSRENLPDEPEEEDRPSQNPTTFLPRVPKRSRTPSARRARRIEPSRIKGQP